MKKIRTILISFYLVLLPIICTMAATDQTTMALADSAYQAEDYAQAIALYEQIVANGNEGAVLFYNLGNAYYKNDNTPKALLWYERARLLAPSDEDILHNIAFANQRIFDKIEAVPETIFAKWWRETTCFFTERQWAIVSITSSFCLFLAIILFLFANQNFMRIVGSITLGVAMVLLVFSIVFANKQRNIAQERPEAIVMGLVVAAKNAPNASGKELFVIHEGLKVQITNALNGWVEIRLPNGEKGWITENDIEKI